MNSFALIVYWEKRYIGETVLAWQTGDFIDSQQTLISIVTRQAVIELRLGPFGVHEGIKTAHQEIQRAYPGVWISYSHRGDLAPELERRVDHLSEHYADRKSTRLNSSHIPLS